jgi:hypothetical protein
MNSRIISGLSPNANGQFSVQVLKRAASAAKPLEDIYHRFVLSPGDDLAATQAMIGASLQSLGAMAVEPADWAALAMKAQAVWTPY